MFTFWLIFGYYFAVSFSAINIGLRELNFSGLETIILVDSVLDWIVIRHLVTLGFALAIATAMGYNQKKPNTVYFSLGVSIVMALVMSLYAFYPIEFDFHIVCGIILLVASIILECLTKTLSFTDIVTDLLFSIALTWLFVTTIEKLGLNLISVESWLLTGFIGLIQIWLAANCRDAHLASGDDEDDED